MSKCTFPLRSGSRRGRCMHWPGHPNALWAYGEDKYNVPRFLHYIAMLIKSSDNQSKASTQVH